MTKAVVGSSMRPLGTDGGQGRRFLFHHLPLALASAGFLVVFMTAPRFDAHASAHGDITSGPFPRARAAGGPMGHAAPGDPERDGAPTGMRSHGADHAGRTSHGGHGHTSATRPAEPESTAHVTRDAGSRHSDRTSESRDERADSSLSRRVQQLTVATGYLGVIFLALTLLLGPANLLLRRRNPVSSYLRRDVGIWTAIFSLAHVVAAVLMHVSHGSGVVSSVVHFFVAEDGRPLMNSFGIGNWTGLVASAIVVALLVTSSDVALRTLKAAPWKWLQRLTYALFALVVLHAFFYGAFLRMASPFTLLLVVSIVAVVAGQTAGFWLWRRRDRVHAAA